MTLRRDNGGQLQLLESVMVALFIFVAIAFVSIFRLPTNPATFESTELGNVALDALKVRQAKPPTAADECHEDPCPLANDLDRLVSLALGYRGPTIEAGEDADGSELEQFMHTALPPAAHALLYVDNGYRSTLVAGTGSPPHATVVVARTLASPNWTVHADQLAGSPVIRVNEATGFPTLTDLHDPLNRTVNEDGYALKELHAGRVTANATYGTHSACTVTRCLPFTVVPRGTIGAGAQVLANEAPLRVPTSDLGAWVTLAKHRDADGNDALDTTEAVYLDLDSEGNVTHRDLRLTRVDACRAGAACEAGSFVRTGDADVGGAIEPRPTATLNLRSSDAVTEEGEALYLFANGGTSLDAGDVRITRVGLLPMGSRYNASADPDAAGSPTFQSFDGATQRVRWADLDADGVREEDEPIFLDLVGNGQSASLEPFDVHLNPVGEASARYFYDIKAVVWFGA